MIFFTSDQHYGHANIIRHCGRPFTDVHEMNERMVELHNATVGPDDVVWHLGDFTLKAHMTRGLLSRLHGHHRLVMGNHDPCHPCHGGKAVPWARRYREAGFEEVHERTWLDLPEPLGRTLLCHLPVGHGAPGYDDRYKEWRPTEAHLGDRPLLHGHVHEKWKARGRMLNVGVDVWGFQPVALDQVLSSWHAGG